MAIVVGGASTLMFWLAVVPTREQSAFVVSVDTTRLCMGASEIALCVYVVLCMTVAIDNAHLRLEGKAAAVIANQAYSSACASPLRFFSFLFCFVLCVTLEIFLWRTAIERLRTFLSFFCNSWPPLLLLLLLQTYI